ncbi:hypothetical protein [Streptomyces corynorhini]|uniref:Uncharacterized protein n=1 Tax=Streptomyces corynorhini TaxID=2282652 RepID=A0A370B2J5_9ACTN|nr:hypothetical protein [Streptomyces corynorhini]RDG34589.1 hypothetical protein DVH02_29840 [Streptomyces corynorhini]
MTGMRREPGSHWRRAPVQFATDARTLRRLLTGLTRLTGLTGLTAQPGQQPPDADCPIDFATITSTVTTALEVRPTLPDRAWVETTTLQLRGHLELLLLDYGDSPDTTHHPAHHHALHHALRHDAARLLALCTAWSEDRTTPPLHAYELMRALAVTTRDLAALLQRQQPPPTHPTAQDPPP